MVWVRCLFFFVIPAKAGISFCFLSFPANAKPDSRPCVECPPSLAASHFLLLAQEKVTKEKGTLAAAVCRASMPGKLRKGRYGGSLTVRPCTDSERARILRAPLTGFFLRALAAAERDP